METLSSMKIQSLTASVDLRFSLDQNEVEAALTNLKAFYQKRMQYPFPHSSIARQVEFGLVRTPGTSTGKRFVQAQAKITYESPTELTDDLISAEEYAITKITGLPFYEGKLAQYSVMPADVDRMNRLWRLYRGSELVSQDITSGPSLELQLEICGKILDKEAQEELSSIGSELFLPEFKDGLWYTKKRRGSTGNSIPTIYLYIDVEGTLNTTTARHIADLYEKVKEAVLKHRLVEDYRHNPNRPPLDELVEMVQKTVDSSAPTLREYIHMSTAERLVFPYAPLLSVNAKIPYQKVELKNKIEVKFFQLFFMPECIDSAMIVCGDYAWPGKKV